MSKFRRARNPYVDHRPWSRDQLQRLDRERQALLDEARAGSRQAHAALLSEYWPMMRCYFGRRLSRALAAKASDADLAQSACLLAWRGFDKFRGSLPAQYAKWLLQICYNLLKALQRRFSPDSKRDIDREELLNELTLEAVGQHAYGRSQAPPEEIIAALETSGQLQAALGQLPADERQIVVWRHYDGMTLAAIASRLEISIDAVKRRCKRALAVLKRRLR